MPTDRGSPVLTNLPESTEIRVAFLVNNDGLSDSRVVKTAEVMANAGFNCTVFGCTQSSFSRQTVVRNGVQYQILPLKRSSLISAICALLPRAYSQLMRAAIRRTTGRPLRDVDSSNTSKNSELHSAALISTSPSTIVARTAAELAAAECSAAPQTTSKNDDQTPPRLSLLKRVARTTILCTRWMLRSARSLRPGSGDSFRSRLQPENFHSRCQSSVRALSQNLPSSLIDCKTIRRLSIAMSCGPWSQAHFPYLARQTDFSFTTRTNSSSIATTTGQRIPTD